MKKGYELLGGVSGSLGLPLEYAAGLPRVEMEGFTTVRVEAHRGVLEYGETRVELGAKGARIRISGSGLGLRALSAELAVISGRIRCVEYLFEEAEA